ncbi:MAG: UrcA family protein [Litorimonas sp.]
MRSKTRFILGGLALALTLTSTSASAQTVEFSYAKSELSTPIGAEHVFQRISILAEDICAQEFGRFSPRHQMKIQRCTHEITQEIVDEISHVNLDAASNLNPKVSRKTRDFI